MLLCRFDQIFLLLLPGLQFLSVSILHLTLAFGLHDGGKSFGFGEIGLENFIF
jgi:hypothetical protein